METALLRAVGRVGGVRATQSRVVPLAPNDVGARIVAARLEKAWSQLDLAIAMGVSPATIHRWEKGRLPSVSQLVRLAEVLEKPPDFFTELPQRQAELVDLVQRTDRLLALLEEARDEAERGRSALLESLVSIDARLSTIETLLGAPAARGNQS